MDSQNTTPSAPNASSDGSIFAKLENWLDEMLGKKAPQIPDSWRQTIAKVMPWVTLIIMILALPALLIIFGISAAFIPFAYVGGYHAGWFGFMWVFSLVAIILEIMALPGLFKLQMRGWRFAYWASLVTIVGDLLAFNVGGIIGGIIGLYILFQIKRVYH